MAKIVKKLLWPFGIGVILVGLSYFSWAPLLLPGFFSMHDYQHVVRLQQLDLGLMSGQLPVRWARDMGFGVGYPLFVFYPPLVYYLGEFFHLAVGLGFLLSVKAVWLVAILGAAFSMYFLAKRLYGRLGGIVAAVCYTYFPYHAVDAYVRGALAELFSFVWLPLILLFTYLGITEANNRWRNVFLTGFFLALLMVTHNLIFLPFVGVGLVWIVVYILFSPPRGITGLVNYCVSVVVAFLLSAFFWLPSLIEKGYTIVDSLLIKNLASYKIHFVCLSQLWDSPWGFGGSVAGCVDGISFKIGKVFILLAAVGLVILWQKRSRGDFSFAVASFVGLVFSLFMALDWSQFLWSVISPLWYLQFPWRFLTFAGLFISLLCSGVVMVGGRGRLIVAVVAIALVVGINAKLFAPQTYYFEASDKTLLTDEQIRWTVSGTSFEYLPKGVSLVAGSNGAMQIPIDRNWALDKTAVISHGGETVVGKSDILSGRFSLEGFSTALSQIVVRQVNFPGWEVWVNGKPAEILPPSGSWPYISVSVPPGKWQVEGRLVNTPVRWAGNVISAISLVGWLIMMAKYTYVGRKPKT